MMLNNALTCKLCIFVVLLASIKLTTSQTASTDLPSTDDSSPATTIEVSSSTNAVDSTSGDSFTDSSLSSDFSSSDPSIIVTSISSSSSDVTPSISGSSEGATSLTENESASVSTDTSVTISEGSSDPDSTSLLTFYSSEFTGSSASNTETSNFITTISNSEETTSVTDKETSSDSTTQQSNTLSDSASQFSTVVTGAEDTSPPVTVATTDADTSISGTIISPTNSLPDNTGTITEQTSSVNTYSPTTSDVSSASSQSFFPSSEISPTDMPVGSSTVTQISPTSSSTDESITQAPGTSVEPTGASAMSSTSASFESTPTIMDISPSAAQTEPSDTSTQMSPDRTDYTTVLTPTFTGPSETDSTGTISGPGTSTSTSNMSITTDTSTNRPSITSQFTSEMATTLTQSSTLPLTVDSSTTSSTTLLVLTTTTAVSVAASSSALPITNTYQVQQTVVVSGIDCSLDQDPLQQQWNVTQQLSNALKPTLSDVIIQKLSCVNCQCNVSYTLSYDGYGNPTLAEIADYIKIQTSSFDSVPSVTQMKVLSCSSGVNGTTQGECYFCGTARPCADFDESTCFVRNDRKSYGCRCDRTKRFFRTNYEYDDRCGRTATISWEQMLALCLLLFLIFLLLLALLLFLCRRRRKLAKKAKREPEVLANVPQKPADLYYSGMYNASQMPSDNHSTYASLHRPRPIYSVPRSENYVHQRRTPQNHTFPLRHHPYAEAGLPATYYNETDDRLGILRDLVNEYNLDKGVNERLNLTRDLDDEEIYV